MIIIYEEDGTTVYARGFSEEEYLDYMYPDRKKIVRDIMTERAYVETKEAHKRREKYKLQTKLDQQKKNSRGKEYYHNVMVPRKLGVEPYREVGKKGRPKEKPNTQIIFHGKSKVAFI